MVSISYIFFMKLFISCPFWLGSLLAQELKKLWYTPFDTFQTWTFVVSDFSWMMNINYHSRIANKVYIQIAEWNAKTFDELFEIVKYSDYPQFSSNSNITIKAQSKNSQLNSLRTIQSISHKAVLESIKNFSYEEKREDDLLVILEKNKVIFYLNSSWKALYQRGYRKVTWEAPLKENIAASLLLLSGRKFKSPMYDYFCWSWTIAIEAALLAKNIAPWTRRHFTFEHFKNFEKLKFEEIKKKAKKNEFKWEYQIFASDINDNMVNISKDNAKIAGVDNIIKFSQKDFLHENIDGKEKLRIISNPPYWKRIWDEKELRLIYEKLQKSFYWNIFWWWISSRNFIWKDKNIRSEKKLFNWNEECTFYRRKPN